MTIPALTSGWKGAAGLPGGELPVLSRPSLLGLLAANLVPLAGVLFLGWSLHEVLLLYWLESGVIGLWAVPRILLAKGRSPDGEADGPGTRLFMAVFFLVHYGAFWIGHLVLLGSLFELELEPGAAAIHTTGAARAFYVAAAALFISHGASFAFNFVEGGERLRTAPVRYFWGPYPRVFVFQATALLGGMLAQALGSPVWTLVLLVLLKTTADAATHAAAHLRS
jgi:hypothetical protein